MARHTQDNLSDRVTRGAPLAVLMELGLFLAYKLLAILELIAIAMLAALVLRTIVRGLERLGAPPWLAVVILLVILGAFGVLLDLAIVPPFMREAQKLISHGPGSLSKLEAFFRHTSIIPIDTARVIAHVKGYLSQLLTSLPTLLATTASWLVGVVAGLFLTLYMAISPGPLISATLRLVPRGRRARFREFLELLGKRLLGWIIGTSLVAGFIGVSSGVGLWLLGAPLPLTFGLIAGILDIIPYFGSVVGAVLPTLMALTISPAKSLEVLVLFVVLNQIESHVLQPQIMGREVNLHPALVIIAFLVFGQLLGLVGAFLAIPAAVLIGVLVEELTEEGLSRKEQQPVEETAADKNHPRDR
jgi:predicted PurR-regulated permease PerM